jgi:Mor family transcriptional regulator
MNQKINPQQLYDYLSDFPGSSITTMAKQFGVTTATIHLIVNKLL